MKTFVGTLGADYERSVTSFARLLKLERADGSVTVGAAAFRRDIPYDDGGGEITYRAAAGADASALEQALGYKSETLDLAWLLDDVEITSEDILAGLWDGARYTIYEVDYTDLTPGRHHIPDGGRGWLGDVTLEGDQATAKMRSLLDAFNIERGRVVTRQCVAPFGDPVECGLDLEPPLWSATTAVTLTDPRNQRIGSRVRPTSFNDRVFRCTTAGTTGGAEPAWNLTIGGTTADGSAVWTTERAPTLEATVDVVTDQRIFTVTVATDAPDDWITRGRVKFTSGPNAVARPMDVKAWDLATKKLTLALPMPFAVTNGETLKIFAGCPKTRAGCKARANIENALGFFAVPLNDEVYKVSTVHAGGGKK